MSARVARKADPAHPVRRPDSIPADQAPARFAANVVEAQEIASPKGGAAVHWLLITDQSIETAEDC